MLLWAFPRERTGRRKQTFDVVRCKTEKGKGWTSLWYRGPIALIQLDNDTKAIVIRTDLKLNLEAVQTLIALRLYFTLLYFTLLYFTLLYFTLLYFTLLYFTLFYFLLYFTLLYFTLLYFTLLYFLKSKLYFVKSEEKLSQRRSCKW
jgi:hypothetical protein